MEECIANILLEHFPAVQAVYLFGSFGTERERPDSDVDIALLLEPKADISGLEECRLELEGILSRSVDLIDIRRANTVFQFEVVCTGRPILIADRTEFDIFEMHTISFYQKLNKERAGIVEAVLESGRALN